MPSRPKDPSRTTTLRLKFMADMNKRFRRLKGDIIRLVVDEDAFGLRPDVPLVLNTRWKFKTNAEKVALFRVWLKERTDAGILEVGEQFAAEPWTAKYVTSAYKKGMVRSYVQTHAEALAESDAFFAGGKAQFLTEAFASPTAVQSIELVGTRAFNELQDITAQMSQQLSRELMDGITRGDGPRQIASRMNRKITGITKKRALPLARTEVIHAHAEGQLDGFQQLNIGKVLVQAEWSTAGDDRVCPQCLPLEGVVMSIKEARGLLPRHPNCRCAWIPADPVRKKPGQLRGKGSKSKAFRKSVKGQFINPKTGKLFKSRKGLTPAEAKAASTWKGADIQPQSTKIKKP